MTTLLCREGVTILCAESEMIDFPADIDLLLTDPPYGTEYRSNRRHRTSGDTIVGDADQLLVNSILDSVWKRIRPHRQGYVFGPKRELPNAKYTSLVWDKQYMSSGALDEPWGTGHEPIGWYLHRYPSEPMPTRLRRSSVIQVSAHRGTRRTGNHPNDKPVPLLRQLIEASSLPGDLIVDPFCGSGSSAVAAILSGRRYFGVDVEERWATQCAERADNAINLMMSAGAL